MSIVSNHLWHMFSYVDLQKTPWVTQPYWSEYNGLSPTLMPIHATSRTLCNLTRIVQPHSHYATGLTSSNLTRIVQPHSHQGESIATADLFIFFHWLVCFEQFISHLQRKFYHIGKGQIWNLTLKRNTTTHIVTTLRANRKVCFIFQNNTLNEL